jgi:hypothetical protein
VGSIRDRRHAVHRQALQVGIVGVRDGMATGTGVATFMGVTRIERARRPAAWSLGGRTEAEAQ